MAEPRRRGRPAGSNFLREHAARSERAAHQNQHEHSDSRSGIEHARFVLQQQRAARASEVQSRPETVFGVARGSGSQDVLTQYGDLHSINTVGSTLQHDMLKSMAHSITSDRVSCSDQELVSVQLSGEMPNMNLSNLGKTTKESNIPTRFLAIGQAVLEMFYIAWNLLFRMLIKMCRNTDYDPELTSRPLVACVRLRYDETPTKVRVDDPQTDGAPSTSCNATHAKIFQVECAVGTLVQTTNNRTKETTRSFVFGEIPTPLYALQTTNGANTAAALSDVLQSLPEFQDLCRDSKFSFRHSCSDQAPANMKAERLLNSQFGDSMKLIHTLCDVHKLYRCTRTSMSGVDQDVSGLLSFALSLGDPGSIPILHQSLAKIFLKRLVPCPILRVSFVMCYLYHTRINSTVVLLVRRFLLFALIRCCRSLAVAANSTYIIYFFCIHIDYIDIDMIYII